MCAVLCEWCVLCAKLFEALGERELLETDLVRAVAVAMAVATAMAMAVAMLYGDSALCYFLREASYSA